MKLPYRRSFAELTVLRLVRLNFRNAMRLKPADDVLMSRLVAVPKFVFVVEPSCTYASATGVKVCGRPTLSKAAVFNCVLSCDVTASPAFAVDAIVTLVDAICVQLTPSYERKLVNVFPERTRRS